MTAITVPLHRSDGRPGPPSLPHTGTLDMMITRRMLVVMAAGLVLSSTPTAAQTPEANGVAYARAIAASERTLQAWLRDADPATGLMPDRVDGEARVATPHNFAADLYPYLILTARLTDPALYDGKMLEMLRQEVRFMTAEASLPGNRDLRAGTLGPASLFGAGE